MNNIVLIGRLTKDPELKYLPNSGTAVSKFTIAVDRDYTKKDGTKETDFIPIEVIGKAAEFCANYITKGRLISIQGSMNIDNYTNESGERRTFAKVRTGSVKALDSSKNKVDVQNQVSEPTSSVPQGFQAIDDDDIPF